MLNWAKLPKNLRSKLWAQCANMATQLENIIVKKHYCMSSHEAFYGGKPKLIKHLRTFGEIAISQIR
jgi:adenylate kinase